VVFSYSAMYHVDKVSSHLGGVCSVHIVTYGVIVNIMHGMYSSNIITELVFTYFVRVLGWVSLSFARPSHTQDSKQTDTYPCSGWNSNSGP